jgi:hypothetical protein
MTPMRKRSKAQFEYRIGERDGFKFLLIADKNFGERSVTNDIENVVADIADFEGITPTEYIIIYRDTEGNWDGWDAKSGNFFFFRNSHAVLEETIKTLTF